MALPPSLVGKFKGACGRFAELRLDKPIDDDIVFTELFDYTPDKHTAAFDGRFSCGKAVDSPIDGLGNINALAVLDIPLAYKLNVMGQCILIDLYRFTACFFRFSALCHIHYSNISISKSVRSVGSAFRVGFLFFEYTQSTIKSIFIATEQQSRTTRRRFAVLVCF